jgi:hypothetical protein
MTSPIKSLFLSLFLLMAGCAVDHPLSSTGISLGAMSQAQMVLEFLSLDPVMAELVRWSQKLNYGSLACDAEGACCSPTRYPRRSTRTRANGASQATIITDPPGSATVKASEHTMGPRGEKFESHQP